MKGKWNIEWKIIWWAYDFTPCQVMSQFLLIGVFFLRVWASCFKFYLFILWARVFFLTHIWHVMGNDGPKKFKPFFDFSMEGKQVQLLSFLETQIFISPYKNTIIFKKILLKETQILQDIYYNSIIINLKFQHKPKLLSSSFKNPHINNK
jgi:hypothetical protein